METCRSDFVEIMENDNLPSPRNGNSNGDGEDEFHHSRSNAEFHVHTFESGRPGTHRVFRHSGPGFHFEQRTFVAGPMGRRQHQGSTNHADSADPSFVDGPFGDEQIAAQVFTTMLRNIVGNGMPRNRPDLFQGEGDSESREGGNGLRGGIPLMFHGLGPGARLNPRDAGSPQAGEAPHVPGIAPFLASLFGPSEPGAAFVARLFGSASGDGGDYVYSQAELDRIISQLMEQHQGNAPPPASKEDIEALPKVKVTEQMVKDDMDCVVCKEDLVVDEIATPLPCKHTYHFECISKWLEAHDTCPICRKSIASEEQQTNMPSNTTTADQGTDSPSSGWPFNILSALSGGSRPSPSAPRNGGQPSNEANRSSSGGSDNSGANSSNNSGFAAMFRRR